jgi:hypothetical protein
LLGEGNFDCSDWIDRFLQELSNIFALSVGGFSVLDNHMQVLLRLDPDVAQGWSDAEVVRRWRWLFPPRDKSRQQVRVSNDWVEWRLKNSRCVATARTGLQSLSWFMKCPKEPLSRLANRQDQTRGASFEGRFKSVAILDEESLLATCAYIDLNPAAAGIVKVPEANPHTSVKTRVEHVKAHNRSGGLQAAKRGSVAGSMATPGLEESLWLCPIEDRRRLDSSREGMMEGFSLGNYLLLVDYTGRRFREGRAVISGELSGVLDRLGSSAESWWARLKKLSRGRLLGRFFAASRVRVRELARDLGVNHVANGRLPCAINRCGLTPNHFACSTSSPGAGTNHGPSLAVDRDPCKFMSVLAPEHLDSRYHSRRLKVCLGRKASIRPPEDCSAFVLPPRRHPPKLHGFGHDRIRSGHDIHFRDDRLSRHPAAAEHVAIRQHVAASRAT